MRRVSFLSAAALIAVVAVPSASKAQWDIEQARGWAGAQAGAYYPSSSELRDLLGDWWLSFGFTSVRSAVGQRSRFQVDTSVLTRDRDGNKIFILSPTAGITVTMADRYSSTIPYFSVRGGPSYMDYAITRNHLDRFSGKKIGFNGNVEVGVLINNRLNISARYDVFSKHDDFQFDGLTLQIRYGFLQF